MNVPFFGKIEVTADLHSEIDNLSPCRHIQNFSSHIVSGTPWAKSQSDSISIALLLHHFRPSFQFSVHLHAAPIQPTQTSLNKTVQSHVFFVIVILLITKFLKVNVQVLACIQTLWATVCSFEPRSEMEHAFCYKFGSCLLIHVPLYLN